MLTLRSVIADDTTDFILRRGNIQPTEREKYISKAGYYTENLSVLFVPMC